MSYTCEWERDDCPTTGMTQAAMLKYYKSRAVAGWCRFMLENPTSETSPALRAAIQALADRCQTTQKPAHKAERDALARRWGAEASARLAREAMPLAPYQPGHLRMAGWDDGAPTPTPVPAPRRLPVTPHTVSFTPSRVLARYERRAA